MRTTTIAQDNVLSAATYQVTRRIKVANGSGTMKDWTSWVEEIDTDENIDQPVEEMDIAFRRDFGATLSLNPLKTDSTLNVLDDNVTFSPAIDVGRTITYESATTPTGVAPVAGDYNLLFTGTIDDLDFDSSPMRAVCRDPGGDIVDAWVETEVAYPAIGSLEAGIQRVLDARFGAGIIPLFTPVSPGYALNAYKQQVQSVAAAVDALEQLTGWDVRYLWDNTSSTFKYTLWDPGRAKVVPDYTFAPSRGLKIKKLGFQKRSVRNVIIISYKDAATGTRQTVTVSDATSITRYKRQVLLDIEPDDSPINSAAQATTMANNMLADLKDPKAEFQIEMFHWWPAMLNDLYRFNANVRWFNTAQDWAVVGIQHHTTQTEDRTTLTVRGKPTGGYNSWINRGDPHGDPGTPNPKLQASITQGATFTDVQESVLFSTDGGDAPLQWRWRTVDARTGAGAWSAWLANSGGNLLPHDQLVSRGLRWNKIVEFQYQDGAARFSNTASYVIDGVFDTLDTTTGRLKRAVPADDGNYHTAASTTDGMTAHSSVKESGTKPINRLFAKTLPGDPDSADSVGVGLLQRAVPFSTIDNGDNFLKNIHQTATLHGAPGYQQGRAQGEFKETFEGFLPTMRFDTANPGSMSNLALVAGVSTLGGQTLRVTGECWFLFPVWLPYDSSKLYRIRARINRASGGAPGTGGTVQVGVAGLQQDRVTYNNNSGANSPVSQNACCAFNVTPTIGTWVDYTGFFGNGFGSFVQPAPNANTPSPMHASTSYFRPYVYFFSLANVGDQVYIDSLAIDIFDEDGTFRTYTALEGSGSLQAATQQRNGTGLKNVTNGRYTLSTATHAQSITYPSNYQNPPAINILGGISYEPASVWGTAAQADAGGTGVAAPNAARQIDEVTAYNVTASTASIRARLRQASASTARSNAFAAGAITTDGGTLAATLANAPAANDTYTVDYTYAFASTGIPGKTGAVSGTVYLDYFNGSVWINVASATHADSNIAAGSASTSGSNTLSATISGLTGTSQLRVRLGVNAGSGTRTYSVDPGNATYSTTAGDQYATKTPANLGINLSVEVIGAS